MVVIPILSYNIHTSDLLKLQEKGRPSDQGISFKSEYLGKFQFTFKAALG
jgi:hypothetical protein